MLISYNRIIYLYFFNIFYNWLEKGDVYTPHSLIQKNRKKIFKNTLILHLSILYFFILLNILSKLERQYAQTCYLIKLCVSLRFKSRCECGGKTHCFIWKSTIEVVFFSQMSLLSHVNNKRKRSNTFTQKNKKRLNSLINGSYFKSPNPLTHPIASSPKNYLAQ